MLYYRTKNKKISKNNVKEYRFLSFARNLSDKYGKKLQYTATKARLDAAETALKNNP